MQTMNLDGRNVVAIEHSDFDNWVGPPDYAINVLLVPKEMMGGFRETEVFKSLWPHITDTTRIVYW
jgi:hypothetical protein